MCENLKCLSYWCVSQSGVILKLILYQDDFEVVNPFGSAKKKHKIVGVYFALANYEPFFRSSGCSFCTQSKIWNTLGMRNCFQECCQTWDSEENGLVTSSSYTVCATVLCIIGDNLGSHCIGGFAENFSTSSHILVPREEIDNVNVGFPVRTVKNYKEAVQLLKDSGETTVNGVNFDSLFNGLQDFHVCQPRQPKWFIWRRNCIWSFHLPTALRKRK